MRVPAAIVEPIGEPSNQIVSLDSPLVTLRSPPSPSSSTPPGLHSVVTSGAEAASEPNGAEGHAEWQQRRGRSGALINRLPVGNGTLRPPLYNPLVLGNEPGGTTCGGDRLSIFAPPSSAFMVDKGGGGVNEIPQLLYPCAVERHRLLPRPRRLHQGKQGPPLVRRQNARGAVER